MTRDCVEKVLKAAMIAKEREYEKDHYLKTYLNYLFEDYGLECHQILWEACNVIGTSPQGYYLETRFPDCHDSGIPSNHFSASNASEALFLAYRAVDKVFSLM